MAATYTLIESYTVGAGGASSVTLGSGGTIPQTYTDLKLLWSGRTTRSSTGSYAYISFNGSTSTFSGLLLGGYGTGTTSASQTQPAGIETDANATASTFANNEIYIPNYTSSNYKSFSVDSVSENNGSTGFNYLFAGLWSTGSAITSITITPESGGNWVQYSTFYLYGIKNS